MLNLYFIVYQPEDASNKTSIKNVYFRLVSPHDIPV